jgi:hypothetical protein
VPYLPGAIRRAVVELTVQDYPSADSRTDSDSDRVARAARGSSPPLAQHGAVGIVVERRRELQPLVNDCPERQVDPAKVGGQQHDAALGIERARCPHSHADDLRPWYLTPGLCDRPLRQRDQAIEYVALPRLRARRFSAKGQQCRAVLGHAAHHQVGSPDINSEDKSHATPPD